MREIIKNQIQCKYCGDIIESTHVHDFKWCSCGKVFVDGGHEYLRRGFPDTYEEGVKELSHYIWRYYEEK